MGVFRDSMTQITATDQTMSNFLGLETVKRTKRSWEAVIPVIGEHVLHPLAQGLSNKLFGKQGMPDLSVYNQRIAQLQKGQEDLNNYLNTQTTIFRIDSEKKNEQIEHLKITQSKIELNLKIQRETLEQDSSEKEKKITNLQILLNECEDKIRKQKEAQDEAANETEILKENVKSLSEGLESIKKMSERSENRIDAIEMEAVFNRISTNFNILVSRFQSEQKTLFEVIINSNRGFLDPYIITPLNLIEMMLNVQANLPEGNRFPLPPSFENARKLYNLIAPNFFLYNGNIIFVLKMHIVNNKTFNLFKMTSFPFTINNNTFGFVLPQQPYLLTDQQDIEYTLVSENELQISCTNIEHGLFLCTRIQTNYVEGSNLECEVRIFLSKEIIPDQCDIRLMYLRKPVFIQLLEHKTWIYAAPNRSDFVVSCDHNRKIEKIANTGILKLGNCSAFAKQVMLQPYLDPKFQKVYGNYSSDTVSLKKYIHPVTMPLTPAHKGNILPFKYDDLKSSSTSLKEISLNIRKDNGDESTHTVKNVTIIVLTCFIFITIIIAIILTRDNLLKLSKTFVNGGLQLMRGNETTSTNMQIAEKEIKPI